MKEKNVKINHLSLQKELFLKHDYKTAIDDLLIVKNKYKRNIFHYNLGTLYGKKGELAASRYHLEKALKYGTLEGKILHNLNVVKTKMNLQDLSVSKSMYDKALDFALIIPSAYYSIISIILLLFVLLGVKKKIIVHNYLRWILIISCLAPILVNLFYLDSINHGIVLNDTRTYVGPSRIFQEKEILKAGSKVIVGKPSNGWFFIKHPNFLAGWVKKSDLALY